MASKLKIFAPRQNCAASTEYYVCSANGFVGCCSVDPCALPGCPDNAPSSTTEAESVTAAATSSTPEATIAEASSTDDPEPRTTASSPSDDEPFTTTSAPSDSEPTFASTTDDAGSTTDYYPDTTAAYSYSDYSYTATGGPSIETTAYTSQGTLLTTTISRQTDGPAPSSSSTSQGVSTHTSSSVPIGAVVGGVLGALVLGALLAFLLVFFRRRRQRRDPEYSPPQASHRTSMASLGNMFRFDAKHATSPDSSGTTPATPSKLNFWKRDSKALVSAEVSDVPQLDGYPVSTGRYNGELVELPDTSRPVELPAGDVPRRRGSGG